MASIECHVVSGKVALVALDELFPECKTFSSERTPRLVCLPEPHSCSNCQSLKSMIRRLGGLFTASEWKTIVLFWKHESRLRGIVSESSDPAEVRLIIINRYSLKLLLKSAEEYVIDMTLYT